MHRLRMAQECGKINEGKSVHRLDHKPRLLAGTPALVEFNKRREEEGLFRKMSFKIVHGLTLSVYFLFSQLYLKLPI